MRRRSAVFVVVLLSTVAAWSQPPVDYYVSLANARERLVRVRIHLAGTSAERDLKLPVWNALYQIRDFAQYVRWIKAKDAQGRPLPIRKIDKTTWRILRAESGAEVEYEILADQGGPYGAQLNSEHAFFNLAQLLMYPADSREAMMTVSFTDLPPTWQIATQLASLRPGEPSARGIFTARNYDRLVDAPVELGIFREASFVQGKAKYRIAVHADAADYDMGALVSMIKKVVAGHIDWMADEPLSEYLFIYHFPHYPGGGGMEHAYSTAIELSAERIKEDPVALYSVTSHEFFHLWNVKRIRPEALDPIDYLRENYTRALWFSEGVTNTVADLVLLKAGLMDEQTYLRQLALEIRTLETRPAHRTQSVEEASLDTWFDKYPQYRLPERSIDYYNKGEILGVLLDLAVRESTHGRKSLRDVFHWMNKNYVYEQRPFQETAGVLAAVNAVTGGDLSWFFQAYVSGTADIPYSEFFRSVGLRLERRVTSFPEPGFVSVKNFDQPPFVISVEPGSEAERAGLVAGDNILSINGKPVSAELETHLSTMRIGDTVKFKVSGRKGQREIKLRLGGREQDDYFLVPDPQASPAQLRRRAAWLSSSVEQ